jgi:hypothetical protein
MAILFDGDDHLTKDYSGTGPISSYPVTLSAWIKPNSLGASPMNKDFQDFVISDGSDTARIGIGAAKYERWGLYTGNNKAPSAGGQWSRTSANPWTNFVGVFNDTNDRDGYINGSDSTFHSGSNITSNTLSDADIVGAGYGPTNGNNALSLNTVAECALWNVALTAAEIDALAAGFSPLFIRPGSLVGYWPLGGAYSDYIDPIGSNTLSATGDPAAADHPRIIYPTGVSTFDYAAPVVEEVAAAERSWFFESMELHIAESGGRRHSAEDNPTAATDKGWYLESLEAGVSPAGKRRK